MAARSRRDARENPNAQVTGDQTAEELLADDYVVAPLRRHALPPITDGAAAIILAAGDRAAELCERPAWITGMDHRIETHALGARDLTTSSSTRTAGVAAGVVDGADGSGAAVAVEVAELHAPFAHQELILRDALGLGDGVTINPSGGRPGRQRGHGGRARPDRGGGQPDHGRIGVPVPGPRHLGALSAAEPGLRPGGRAVGAGRRDGR